MSNAGPVPPPWLLSVVMKGFKKSESIQIGTNLCSAFSRDLPLNKTVIRRRKKPAYVVDRQGSALKMKRKKNAGYLCLNGNMFSKNKEKQRTSLLPKKLVRPRNRATFLRELQRIFQLFVVTARQSSFQGGYIQTLTHIPLVGAHMYCHTTKRRGVVVRDTPKRFVVMNATQSFSIRKRRYNRVSVYIMESQTSGDDAESLAVEVTLNAHKFIRQ
eukprot:PhF_6_TR18590/c0_g1_i1/m.27155